MSASRAPLELRPCTGGSRTHSARYSARLVALIALLLAACGGDDDDDEDSQKTTPVAGDMGGTPGVNVLPPSTTGNAAIGDVPMGAGGDSAAGPADAGHMWPSCGTAFDDQDGGVSPYADACAIDERFGVFVNPGVKADAFADGSREHPFATLERAVATAVNANKHVFACEGQYDEPLRIGTELSDGLHVYGGLSCTTFAIESMSARSRVRATGGPALIVANTRDVLIERFEFESAPASTPEPGANHVGAFVQNARRVLLRDVLLHAHDGETGKDGAPPPPMPAGDGTVGSNGGNACSARPNPGGAAISNANCRTQSSTASGKGGDGGEGSANGGNGSWFGVAQIQGENGAAWSCMPGMGGAPMTSPGFPGQAGRGGRGFGALLATGFLGFGGQDGSDGGPGQGGGGGGGAKAPASCANGTAVGASGGGGGTGGCGGKGGEGGQAGGSSIGLLAASSTVRMERGEIRYGNGGDGGDGAEGQKGGKGAAGGRGGQGSGGSRAACDGAAGGNGGDGGAGGGGNGGHAFGVLFAGTAPALMDVTGEANAAGHRGGAGGMGLGMIVDVFGAAGQTAFQFKF